MLDNKIDDKKVVLITGAAKRIGRSLSFYFAKKGFIVCLHYFSSSDEAELLKKEIISQGAVAETFCCDLADHEQTKNMFLECVQKFGKVDCLINNASLFVPDSGNDFTIEQWHNHMNTNLLAPAVLSQCLYESISKDDFTIKNQCNIINLIDQRVWRLTPHFFSYTLSKSALFTMTKTLAQAFAPHIRVNAIGPGPTIQSIHQTDKEFNEQCEEVLLGYGASTEDICNCAWFMVNSPSMTGQMVAMDSGEHLTWNMRDFK